jgi:hypothetical protein
VAVSDTHVCTLQALQLCSCYYCIFAHVGVAMVCVLLLLLPCLQGLQTAGAVILLVGQVTCISAMLMLHCVAAASAALAAGPAHGVPP